MTKEISKKVEKFLLSKEERSRNKVNIQLDKEVFDFDKNLINQYYKIKNTNSALVLKLNMSTKKIEHLSLDHNYIDLKTLRKKFKV